MSAAVTVLAQMLSHPAPFHPSQLLSVASTDPLSALLLPLGPDFRFTVASDHYDGVYFLAMALDPLALGDAHNLIDLGAYRYGHPLWGWVAMLLSLGQAAALPWAFWTMSVASMALASGTSAIMARRAGASPWIGLVVAVSPGLIFSATTALTEPFQIALICTLLLIWQASPKRNWLLALTSVALCLTKEQLVLVPIALGLMEATRALTRQPIRWRSLIALACGPGVLAVWLVYVRSRFSAEQSTYDGGNIGAPVTGWLETFALANGLRVGDFHASQIGSTAVPGLIATAALLILASIIGVRRPNPLGAIVALQTVLISTLGWRTLLYPHEMFRIPSVAVTLAALLLLIHLSAPQQPSPTKRSNHDRHRPPEPALLHGR